MMLRMRAALAVAVVIVVAAGLAVLFWPQAFGLEHAFGVAQLLAFRSAAVLAVGALVVVLLLVALVWRRGRAFVGALIVVTVMFGAASTALVVSRGFGRPGVTDGAGPIVEGREVRGNTVSVTLLSWNTLGGAVDPATIAELAERVGARVITLPETTAETANAVAALMEASGTPMWATTISYSDDLAAQSTSLLIARSLGEYSVTSDFGNTSTLPSVVARPVIGGGPIVAAVHPVAPIPGEMANWRSDLEWVGRLCQSNNLIVGGDFNSTLDHLTNLSKCTDAAAATGAAGLGSWPTTVPALLAAPIDHVMTTNAWRAVAFEVVETEDAAGSDHRPVVAVLQRNAAAGTSS